MTTTCIKPPLGVMPRLLWDERWNWWFSDPRAANAYRLADLAAASLRYRAAGKVPPNEWLEEWTVILTCYLIIGSDPP